MYDITTVNELASTLGVAIVLTWIGGWLFASAMRDRHAELLRRLEAMADALRERH